MTEKVVNFPDKQGRNIVGTLTLPEGNGPFPMVIICHGFKGDRKQIHIMGLAEELTRPGLGVFRFDFTRDPGESSLPFAEMTVSYELEVLDEVVNYLRNFPEVKKEKIGLVGHSVGGLVVSWYTAEHPEISALVPLSAVYSFLSMWKDMFGEETVKEMREKGFSYVFSERLNKKLRINKEFYDDAAKYDMDRMIEDIECPMLVVCGTDDKLLTHSQHYLDRSITQAKELKIVKGADHNYTKPQDLEIINKTVAEFFAKTLIADTK